MSNDSYTSKPLREIDRVPVIKTRPQNRNHECRCSHDISSHFLQEGVDEEMYGVSCYRAACLCRGCDCVQYFERTA